MSVIEENRDSIEFSGSQYHDRDGWKRRVCLSEFVRFFLFSLGDFSVCAIEYFSGAWPVVNTNSRLEFARPFDPLCSLGFVHPVDTHVRLLFVKFSDDSPCQEESHFFSFHVFDEGLVFLRSSSAERPKKTRVQD
ncbi:hypothetical protein [Halostagnicola kamekurae]|uniref:hypothetical protein n=1 Tax=Halostagnicola kamekurae TaxID=619731 RepID=UPI001587057C|nr:hypothetical protein [Halostagnicola kamekurae]